MKVTISLFSLMFMINCTSAIDSLKNKNPELYHSFLNEWIIVETDTNELKEIGSVKFEPSGRLITKFPICGKDIIAKVMRWIPISDENGNFEGTTVSIDCFVNDHNHYARKVKFEFITPSQISELKRAKFIESNLNTDKEESFYFFNSKEDFQAAYLSQVENNNRKFYGSIDPKEILEVSSLEGASSLEGLSIKSDGNLDFYLFFAEHFSYEFNVQNKEISNSSYLYEGKLNEFEKNRLQARAKSIIKQKRYLELSSDIELPKYDFNKKSFAISLTSELSRKGDDKLTPADLANDRRKYTVPNLVIQAAPELAEQFKASSKIKLRVLFKIEGISYEFKNEKECIKTIGYDLQRECTQYKTVKKKYKHINLKSIRYSVFSDSDIGVKNY